MTLDTRYDLVRISESRLGLIGRPWISPVPPARPAPSWGRIVPVLLCLLTLAATIYAGGNR